MFIAYALHRKKLKYAYMAFKVIKKKNTLHNDILKKLPQKQKLQEPLCMIDSASPLALTMHVKVISSYCAFRH